MNWDLVEKANREAIAQVVAVQPLLADVMPAIDAVPGMTAMTVLHAGPPIEWSHMCGPMKGAVLGALFYEGLAEDTKAAEALIRSGRVILSPCHDHQCVGPMAGVISASMPVFVVEDIRLGNRAFSTLNEGPGRVLRYGVHDKPVIRRLKWLEQDLAPLLKAAIARSGGIELGSIMAEGLHMGDEGHTRLRASTALFIRKMAPLMLESGPGKQVRAALRFIAQNEHFFLNTGMAACKLMMDAIKVFPYSTVVTAMCRNGTDFGLRVSGLGDRWFTAPAGRPEGLYFSGYGPTDANPDIGDSAITETLGFGAFALAAAPAVVQFLGLPVKSALQTTLEMSEITVAENMKYTIPSLGFQGVPIGIDIRRVVQTGIAPLINTGIAHRKQGMGQIGAGFVRAPMACFEKALKAFGEKYLNSIPAAG